MGGWLRTGRFPRSSDTPRGASGNGWLPSMARPAWRSPSRAMSPGVGSSWASSMLKCSFPRFMNPARRPRSTSVNSGPVSACPSNAQRRELSSSRAHPVRRPHRRPCPPADTVRCGGGGAPGGCWGCPGPVQVGGFAGVAVVESDDLKAPIDQRGAEVVVPVQHVGADAHDQQQRIVGAAEALVGDLDAVVIGR